MSRAIIAMLPPHRTYVEGFGGGAQVLFRKPPSPVEVLNDIDDDIVTLYRVVQHHWEEFVRVLRYELTSRTAFHIWQKTNPCTLTDIHRAVRFFLLQKLAFGGLVRNRTYRCFFQKRPNFNPLRVREVIEAIHERLAHVQIEALPYEQILKKFDRDNQTVFLLDPPYYKRTLYNHNFSLQDFQQLAAVLSTLQGRFILTISAEPEMRALFAKFNMFSITVVYSANQDGRKRFTELLVTNFMPPRLPTGVYPLQHAL